MAEQAHERMAQGGSSAVLGLAFGTGVMLAAQVLVARILGAQALGEFALARSVLDLVAVGAGLGLHQGIMRSAAVLSDGERPAWPRTILWWAGISSWVALLLFLTLATAITRWLDQDASWGRLLVVVSGALPFQVLMGVSASYALGRHDVPSQRFILNVLRPVFFLGMTVALLAIGFGLGGVATALVAGTAVAASFGVRYVYRFSSAQASGEGVQRPPDGLLRYSLTFLSVGLVYMVVQQADRLLLGALGGGRVVAVYVAAASIALLFSMVQAGFLEIFAPLASSLHHQGKTGDLIVLFNRATKWSFAMLSPVLFVALAFPRAVVFLFGNGFEESAAVFMLLVVGQAVLLSLGAVGPLVQMTGGIRADLAIAVILLIVNVLLNLVLVPRWGAIGAAIAFSGSFILAQLMRLAYLTIRLRASLFLPSVWGPWAASAVAFAGAGTWVASMGHGLGRTWLPALAAAVAYGVGLVAVGIDQEDRHMLGRMGRAVWPFGRHATGP